MITREQLDELVKPLTETHDHIIKEENDFFNFFIFPKGEEIFTPVCKLDKKEVSMNTQSMFIMKNKDYDHYKEIFKQLLINLK